MRYLFWGWYYLQVAVMALCIAYSAWDAWRLTREDPSRGSRPRGRLRMLLPVFTLLAPIQIGTGYSLRFHNSRGVVYFLAFVSYVLAMVLLWNRHRFVAGVGLAVPGVRVLFDLQGFLILAFLMFAGHNSTAALASGRLSPSLSYQIVQSRGGLMSSITGCELDIYQNPRWLPLIQKPVGDGIIPCYEPTAARISLAPDGRSVFVSHAYGAREGLPPIKIPLYRQRLRPRTSPAR